MRHLVPGSEIESVYILDARSDPIAEHHTLGGRRVSALDPSLKGLPVLPFAVMAEMTAQAAALVVPAGSRPREALRNVRAHKWVRYEDEPVLLELRGRREPSPQPGEERVWVGLFNRGPGGRSEAPRPVFEAVAVFAAEAPDPPPADPWALEDARPSRFTAESIYAEQWLFHGPAMQAVVEVGRDLGRRDRRLAARAARGSRWSSTGRPARLHTDVIVIDSFTHLLGCWGLDHLADRGDVVFPLRMEELRALRRTARGRHRRRLPDRDPGAAAAPHPRRGRDRPARRDRLDAAPQLGRLAVPLAGPIPRRLPPAAGVSSSARNAPLDRRGLDPCKAVWLAPPPTWAGPSGATCWSRRSSVRRSGPSTWRSGGPDDVRSRRLWGRIAAKEAARRIWHDEGRGRDLSGRPGHRRRSNAAAPS